MSWTTLWGEFKPSVNSHFSFRLCGIQLHRRLTDFMQRAAVTGSRNTQTSWPSLNPADLRWFWEFRFWTFLQSLWWMNFHFYPYDSVIFIYNFFNSYDCVHSEKRHLHPVTVTETTTCWLWFVSLPILKPALTHLDFQIMDPVFTFLVIYLCCSCSFSSFSFFSRSNFSMYLWEENKTFI